MRFSIQPSAYILLLLLASLANLDLVACSDGSDAMKKLCSSLSRATSCKASFKIPTFKVRTGKTDWFKFNPCKTTFRFPFGGKQCLPGTDKVVITVPIGIDVGSKSVDACSLARQAIPGLEQLAQKSGAICTCLPEVRLVVWRFSRFPFLNTSRSLFVDAFHCGRRHFQVARAVWRCRNGFGGYPREIRRFRPMRRGCRDEHQGQQRRSVSGFRRSGHFVERSSAQSCRDR